MNNTLIKGLKLLEVLAYQVRPMGVTELAAATGMPKSGAHRLLQALLDESYVVRRSEGSYAASMKLWEIASAALPGFDLCRRARPVMEALASQTGETVHLAVLDGDQVVYVHKVMGRDKADSSAPVGTRAPAHCVATGKAMLAFKTKEQLLQVASALRPITSRTITDSDTFLGQMHAIRRDGYAVTKGEWREGFSGVAAPVFGQAGEVSTAIGVSGSCAALSAERIERLACQVKAAARQLSVHSQASGPQSILLNVMRDWQPIA
ncbi:IclR family transcriptional regulator [Ottowia sp. VDI28]|uniref:IclR family transcriptional regulator n=1 Tax=Ottowia sp. VDI28 TaxID=3133968 RepID=UPI003C2CF4EE